MLWFCNSRIMVPFHAMHDTLCQYFPFPVFHSFHIPSHISCLLEMNTICSRTSWLLTLLGALHTSPSGAAAPAALARLQPRGSGGLWRARGRWPRCGRGGSGPPTSCERGRAEPSQQRQGRAERGRAEPSGAESNPAGLSRAQRGRAEPRHHAGHGEELPAEHGGGMALPPAAQGREGLCRAGLRWGAARESGGRPWAARSSWQRLHPHLLPQDQVSYEERTYEGGKFAAVELVGKPFDEASKEGAVKLLKYVGGSNDKGEDVACPAGLGGCWWLRLGESRMDWGNGTAGPSGLWPLARGIFDGDGPSLVKLNLQQAKSCPANSFHESAYNPSLFQDEISKIICLNRNELP